MYILTFIWGGITVLLNNISNTSPVLKKYYLLLLAIMSVITFSLRGSEIPDTDEYEYIYNNLSAYDNIELGFQFVINLFRSFDFSFFVFLLFVNVFLVLFWFLIMSHEIYDLSFSFWMYYSYIGLFYYGIITRASIAITICLYALCFLINRKTVKAYFVYFFLISISLIFHQTMLVFYLFPCWIFKNIKTRYLICFLLLSCFIPYLNIQYYLLDFIYYVLSIFSFNRFDNYIQKAFFQPQDLLFTFFSIKILIESFVLLYMRKYVLRCNLLKYNAFLNTYILGFFLLILLGFFPSAGRLALIFLFFEFFMFSILWDDMKTLKVNRTILIFFPILNFIVFLYRFPMFI